MIINGHGKNITGHDSWPMIPGSDSLKYKLYGIIYTVYRGWRLYSLIYTV